MNTIAALEALSRERPLTEQEVNRLLGAMARTGRPTPPSQTNEAKRACYARNRDKICARNRERWDNDPEYRERKRLINKASYERRKKRLGNASC